MDITFIFIVNVTMLVLTALAMYQKDASLKN